MKELLIGIGLLGALFLGGVVFEQNSPTGGPGGGFAGGAASMWRVVSSIIQPVNTSWGLRIPSLANENCIGTDADGDFQSGSCGADHTFPFTVDNSIGGVSTSTIVGFNAGLVSSTSTTGTLVATSSITISAGGSFIFDSQTFDSLTDDATLSNNSGDLRVVDVNCSDCLDDTEIDPSTFILNELGETSLADPGSDQIVFWDDSDTQFEFISTLTGLSISANTLSVDEVDISGGTNLAVSGTLLDLTGDTLSINEGTLTDNNLCDYESTGTQIECTTNTSAELAGIISDETGSGVLVFGTAPTFTTSITSTLVIADLIDPSGAADLDLGSADVTDITLITDGGTWIVDNGLTFPDEDDDPTAAGELKYDNTITGLDDGGFVWYDDDEIRRIVDIDNSEGAFAAGDDGHVVTFVWNGGSGYFDLQADDTGGGGGGTFAWTPIDGSNATTSALTVGSTTVSHLTTLNLFATSTDSTHILKLFNDTNAEVVSFTDEGLATFSDLVVNSLNFTFADAGADAVLGWDDTATAYENLTNAEVFTITENGSGGNILLETEIDGCSELLALLDDETGTCGGAVFSDSPTFVDDILLNSAGVLLTGANGDLTILGSGDGQDENLVFNFNDTANEVGITSGTGVTLVDFNTIGLDTDSLTVGADTVTSLDGDATLNIVSSNLRVVDLTCTDCINATEIEDIYLLNSGDVGTGVFDFGGTTSFELTNAADPTVDALGEFAFDTTSINLVAPTTTSSGSEIVLASATTTLYAFSIASTTPAMIDGGFIELPSHYLQQRATAIICQVESGTSAVINLSDDGTNDTNTATCTTTEGLQYAITTNGLFNAYEDIRLEFGTVSGAVDYITIRVVGHRFSD